MNDTLDAESRAREHLDKALNFQNMGMTASAENELNLARQFNPMIVSDPRYKSFFAKKIDEQSQAEAWKFPMRIGAGILIADVLMFILLWALTLASGTIGEFVVWGLVHIGVDIYLAVNLIRLKDAARRSTTWWATIGLVIGALASIGAGSWLDLIMQLSFSGSLLILLLGKPSKIRAGLAVVIFVLGYIGSFCGSFALAFISALG